MVTIRRKERVGSPDRLGGSDVFVCEYRLAALVDERLQRRSAAAPLPDGEACGRTLSPSCCSSATRHYY